LSQPKINWSGDISEKILSYNTKCVVGLDRDGTINEDIGTYIKNPNDLKPIPGSLEAVTKIRSLGHKVVIITNQGGIEKGITSQQEVESVNQRLMDYLGQAGCKDINALYYSTSSRKDDMYAKPNTGMFKRCEKENKDIKFSKGYYVGDKLSDLKAAHKMQAIPVLVRTGYGKTTEKELNKFSYKQIKKRTKIFDTLLDFANWLESTN
jgi:D-glycero-D-manno-heptose 1,7-bisphosphate phosphatase